jgi:rhomboid family GlyGly-CTERM serine protease
MLMNLAALAVLAFICEKLLTLRDWIPVGLSAALAIDLGLFWLHPSVVWYVGLSGVLHGFWSAACVRGFELRRAEAIPLTLVLLAKLGYELTRGPLPITSDVAAGPVIYQAHLLGAIGGVFWPLVAIAIRRRQRSL